MILLFSRSTASRLLGFGAKPTNNTPGQALYMMCWQFYRAICKRPSEYEAAIQSCYHCAGRFRTHPKDLRKEVLRNLGF